ncbi:MAG TPA: hypothetical protein VI934_04230, partial [Candidatus Nanoarchaeia archaeon]|nr:hypothetical protein [Candidatus Nanoarchaeia archaeon]
ARYGTATPDRHEEIITANFTVVKSTSNSNYKLQYNSTYQVGTAVNLTANLTEYNLLVQTGTQTYHYLGLKGGFSFTPAEAGNYSIQLLLADSTQDTISLWATERAEESLQAAQHDTFTLAENITLLLNLSLLSQQHSSFFDRILGRSAIARLTAAVRDHENDRNFRIGLIPVMKDVFELVLYSSPEIPPGEYSIIVQATTGKEASNYSYEFTWGSTNVVHAEKEEAATAQEEGSSYIEHTFARGNPANFWLNLTDQLPFDRSLLDILLKRPRLDTLTLYIEGQEENALLAPKAEHAANDDFLVTIPWNEGIRPDVYKLVAIASASGNTYRTSVIFNWGQENKTEAAIKASILKKSESNMIILPKAPEEPEQQPSQQQPPPQQQQGQPGQVSQLIKIESDSEISYELQLANESAGNWQATIKFHNQPFTSLALNNISFKEGELGIDTGSVTAPKHARTTSAYAVDPSFFTIDHGSASLTAIAKGGELYICEPYNFSEKTCDSWLAYANLTKGEEYALNFTAAIAVAELTVQQQLEAATQTVPQATQPHQLIHREQETRAKPGSKSVIGILITKPKQGLQDSNETLLTETIPEGWSFDYLPESAAAINSSAFSLRINLTPNQGNGSDLLKLVSYSVISPASPNLADSQSTQAFTSTLAGFAVQREPEPAESATESASTAVLVDGRNTPFSISTEVLSPSGNKLGRELAVNLSYTLKFSITRMAGTATSHPVIFTWPYNSSELELEGVSRNCERARIIGNEGLAALRCMWKDFSPGSSKEFTIQLKPLSESTHTSTINVTYDPAGIIKTAIVKDAPYIVQFTAKEYQQGILLEIWHDSNATLAVKAEGDAKLLLSKASIGKDEKASLLLENYGGEYFTITVGEEVISFGDFPLKVSEGKKEEQDKQQNEHFITRAANGIGSSVKKAFVSVGNAAVNRAKKAAGNIASLSRAIQSRVQPTSFTSPAKFSPKITTYAIVETTPQAQETNSGIADKLYLPGKDKIENKTIPAQQPELKDDEKQPVQVVQQPIKQQAESKRQEEGRLGKDRNPAPQLVPEQAPKPIPKPRATKEWFPTYKTFTILLEDYTPQLSDTAIISREITCGSCDNYTAPANSTVNITIMAKNFRQQASQLVEYVPADWAILSTGGGVQAAHNSTHNRITWKEVGSYSVSETYSAMTPQPSSSSSPGVFKAVLEAEGQSTAGEDHIVLLQPFTISVKDQGSN